MPPERRFHAGLRKPNGMAITMKWVLTGFLSATLLVLTTGSVTAHKGRLPEDALTLVRQASALLAQNPAMTGEVRERLEAALRSNKPQGVHLDQVEEALRALKQQDIARARRLLMASMMPAGMPMPLGSPRAASQMPVVPIPISPTVVRPPAQPSDRSSVDVAMKMAAPLRPRFTGSTAEIAILGVALALIGLGLVSLWHRRGAVQL